MNRLGQQSRTSLEYVGRQARFFMTVSELVQHRRLHSQPMEASLEKKKSFRTKYNPKKNSESLLHLFRGTRETGAHNVLFTSDKMALHSHDKCNTLECCTRLQNS